MLTSDLGDGVACLAIAASQRDKMYLSYFVKHLPLDSAQKILNVSLSFGAGLEHILPCSPPQLLSCLGRAGVLTKLCIDHDRRSCNILLSCPRPSGLVQFSPQSPVSTGKYKYAGGTRVVLKLYPSPGWKLEFQHKRIFGFP